MSSSQADFINSNLSLLKFSSKRDIIENLFIKSLLESYNRIDKKTGVENEIRDRFRNDLYFNDNSVLKKWLQFDILYLDWENWSFTNDRKLARSDFVFKLTGMKFVIECKRLSNANQAYIKEGLERFVNLKYSQRDEFAGMIGFVMNGDCKKICTGIFGKIKMLKHTKSVNNISEVPSFNSIHNRIDNSDIDIYHLFLSFNV